MPPKKRYPHTVKVSLSNFEALLLDEFMENAVNATHSAMLRHMLREYAQGLNERQMNKRLVIREQELRDQGEELAATDLMMEFQLFFQTAAESTNGLLHKQSVVQFKSNQEMFNLD